MHGSRAVQDLSPDSVPETPAEQHEENLVGFCSKLSGTVQEESLLDTENQFFHGSTGSVLFVRSVEQVRDESNMLHAMKEKEMYTVFLIDNLEGKTVQEI